MNNSTYITREEIKFFKENGYFLKKNFVSDNLLKSLQNKVSEHLNNRIKPFELEQEVHYPGSPKTTSEVGGDTIRRLKLAYTRDKVFASWANDGAVKQVLQSLFESKNLYLVQSHHNCVMTKQPQYSSETHWHKDVRYWNFKNNQLINTWLPLGNETIENGCLQVIPGTHLWKTPIDRLDDRLFLRKDLPANKEWLDLAIDVELQEGDLLFFHAGLFHAAGRNQTNQSKNAVVFTYRSDENTPLEKTNSVKFDEVKL